MARQPGLLGYDMMKYVGPDVDKQIKTPTTFQMSGYRPVLMQQIPCKTINDITFPPARISNVNPLAGYKSYTLGHGDNISKETAMFSFPEHPLNSRLLKPVPMFFFVI